MIKVLNKILNLEKITFLKLQYEIEQYPNLQFY